MLLALVVGLLVVVIEPSRSARSRSVVYLKSFLFGIGGAVVGAVLWFVIAFILPMYVPYWVSRIQGTGGVASGYITSDSILVAALIGFIIGFAWEWHRLSAA
jgi:hypothetical protein